MRTGKEKMMQMQVWEGKKNEREVKEDSESRNQRVKEKKLMKGERDVVKSGSCCAKMTAETRGHTVNI